MSGALEFRLCRAEDFEGVVALLGQLWPEGSPQASSVRSLYDDALVSDRQAFL